MSVPSRVTLPGGRLVKAGEHVQRRGLAGTVRPDQRMNAAAPDLDIDVVDGLEATEMLGEAFDGEHDVAADRRGSQLQRGTGGMHLGLGVPALGRDLDESPDAVRHVADDQNDRQTVDREIEPGNALEEPQPFRDQDQQTGADRRADRRGDAAEQGHGEEHDRLGKGELVRADIGETAREQAAGQSAQHRAQRKGGNLGAEDVDADDACGKLVIAHRAHGAPEPRIRRDARPHSRPAPAWRRRRPDRIAKTGTDRAGRCGKRRPGHG